MRAALLALLLVAGCSSPELRVVVEDAKADDIAFGPDGSWFATAGGESILSLRSTKSGAFRGWLEPSEGDALVPGERKAVAVTTDLAAESGHREIWLYSLESRSQVRVITTPGPIRQLTFSPSGKHLVVLTDTQVLVFDPRAETPPERHDVPTSFVDVRGVARTEGALIFSGQGEKAFPVIVSVAVPSGETVLRGPTRHEGSFEGIAVSPDARHVVLAGPGELVTIVALAEMKVVRELRGHGADVRRVAWSPGGDRIGSVDEDGVVHIWAALGAD